VCSHAAEEAPVIAIQVDSLGKRLRNKDAGKHHGLLVAIYGDGRMVWSKDQKNGGEPFLTAVVDKAKVNELLQHWSREIELDKKKFQRGYLGPDAAYHKATLALQKERVELLTWHELYQENPRIVAMPALTPLDGKSREEALKSAPKEYLRFREVWKDIRTSVAALIPEKGEPFEGEITLK
jgi:hypothetical protein